MTTSDLLASLLAATGDLQPTSETTAAELDDLRRAFLESFHETGTAASAASAADSSADPRLAAELRYLIARHLAAPPASSGIRIARREVPIRIPADPALPDWSAALAPTRTFGPFADRAGRLIWHDVFTVSKQLHVRRSVTGPDVLLLPHAIPGIPLRPGPLANITIPEGSIWIAAGLFSASAPAGAYAGIRIRGGTLTIGRLDHIQDDVLVVPPAEVIRLTVTLDQPMVAGPAAGPGADATNTNVVLPEKVTFVIDQARIGSVETTPASLSVYGNALTLTRNQDATAYDGDLRQVLVPLSPSSREFEIRDVRSTLFTPAGAATVERAAWSLPVSVSAPAALSAAAGAGFLLIGVGPGLTAQWEALSGGPVMPTKADILADPSSLVFLGEAPGSSARQTFELWQESAPRRCSVEIRLRHRFKLWFVSARAGVDSVLATGTAQPHVDRPLAAGGNRIDNPIDVTCVLMQRPNRLDLFLGSTQPPDNARGPIALALTNALLTTTLIRQLSLSGAVADGGRIDAGALNLYFGLYQLVPTLPDPYAANFEPIRGRDAAQGAAAVHTQVAWTDPAAPVLTIELTGVDDQLESVLPAAAQPDQLNSFFGQFSAWLGDVRPEGLTLLDVSSNADQLGIDVAFTGRAQPALAIRDLSLSTAALNVRSFLLPQFQWEPVHHLPNPRLAATEPQVPMTLRSRTDGSPALVGANSVRLVPIAPIPVATEMVRAYREDGARTSVLFNLPFGIDAVALLGGRDDGNALAQPALELLRPAFKGLIGAREISVRAGRQLKNIDAFHAELAPLLPGAARQVDNLAPPPPPTPPPFLTTVLGDVVRDGFNARFQCEVPVLRIDLSGYGANIRSRWVNESDHPIDVSQVTFDAFHGRTSYERVHMTTILWPCQATAVRTVTLERYGSGSIVRWDSGWIPTTPGLFWHKFAPDVKFHPGAVRGMFNIREIRDTDRIVSLVDGARVQAVYFDADIEIEGVVRGQDKDGRVPAYRQLGFIQLPAEPPEPLPGNPLTPKQLTDLFRSQGPVGGPVDCVIKLGKSAQHMRVSGVISDASPPEQFAVAPHGSPSLPASGQWSVVRIPSATDQVEPVTSHLGVPLIREGVAKGGPSAKPLRFADPVDLLTPPVSDYAFLFAGHSQRILYARPKVEFNDSNITSELKPQLADPYAMLRAGGLFPKVSHAMPFDTLYPLSNASELLKFVPDVVRFPAPSNFRRPLANASTWLSDLLYHNAAGDPTKVIVDAAKNWSIDVEGVRQILSFDPLGEVMTIIHDIHSPTDDLDSFPKPNILLAPPLQAAKSILTLLENLSPTSAPDGLPAPLQVSVSFSGTTFSLSAAVGFKLEGEDGEPIECGFGKIRGELQIGASLTAEILKAKAGGEIFLQITGSYQQLVFPLIYGGGQLRFRIGADQSGSTSVELDACTMGSVGGTVLPGLIDLEATVKYGYYIRLEGGTFQPGIVLGMEGRAKLVSGLLSFSLSVEGRLLVQRVMIESPTVELRGDVLVAGTVTLAWAFHERRSFHVTYHQELNWKHAVAAGVGLLLIP